MTELKTLKDLYSHCKWYPNCNKVCVQLNPEELRQEAIKWRKSKEVNEDTEDGMMTAYWFIKHFFNLTEEDLK